MKKLIFFVIYNNEKSKPWRKNTIKNIRNLFRLETETEVIKDEILRDIKNVFDEYYKPVRANNFWSNNYIEYTSNSDQNRMQSVKQYLDKSIP